MVTQINATPSLDELLTIWETQGIRKVLFELPDMHGVARSKIIPLNKVRGFAEKGLNMYGGTVALDSRSFVISGTKYNEEKRYADQLLIPDLASAAVVPWLEQTARLICATCWAGGTPLHAAPRHVLRRAVEALDKLGYQAQIGLEYEFYLLDPTTMKPVFDGLHIFNTNRNLAVPVIERIVDLMPQIGIDVITANCEYGPGQLENRLPTALSNPYLAIAAVLAAGTLGLQEEEMPPEPLQDLAEGHSEFEPLPTTLDAALEALESDQPFRAILGDEFVEVYTTIKRSELARLKAHVTDRERDEYMEIY